MNKSELTAFFSQMSSSIRAELCVTLRETIIEQLQAGIAPLIDKIKELETIVIQQREKIDKLERKRNIMVFNYEEKENENWETLEEAMLNLFKEDLGLTCRVEDLDECMRVGTKRDGKTRPIKIGFTSYKKKLSVLRNKKKLKGTKMSKISITEDYSQQVRERRRALIPIVDEMKRRGEFAEIRYDEIFTRTKDSNRIDLQKAKKRKDRT
uniref:Endonuclease-reverse transcriptase n=1 Tax=Cacopsylla melanoneura TaxID=428564 RepID=A0A8D8SFJ1_9HEMI